ncbi:MAG: hypothetical protein JWR55_64, partial [Aeromicrobium sp.]|nr:hypothetical protein [Aeromicrobium sp.]
MVAMNDVEDVAENADTQDLTAVQEAPV